MQIDPAIAGTPLKEFHCTIDWRQSMNYAAAVQDSNPWYFDDERPEGILAPPMQAVSLTWPVFERLVDFLPANGFPLEALQTQVHYTEHLIFHRPLKPGDDLVFRGSIAAILPHRAGTHAVIRLEAFDASGAPVFTEYNGGLLRGVTCSTAGKGADNILSVPRAHPDLPAVWQVPIPVDRLAPFIYDGCTNIYFPIHTSVHFARAVGLPDIILQGTATLALAVREIINREGGADPRCLKSLACRFSAMVLPGETITVQLNERRIDSRGKDLFFVVLNGTGGRAVNHGYARIEEEK